MVRAPAAALTFGLLALFIAGCITSEPPLDREPLEVALRAWSPYAPAEVPDYDFANAIQVAHPHDVRGLHTESYGLRLVGHDNLLKGLDRHVWSGGFIEVDVKGDLAIIASLTGMRAFTLVDISDLSRPSVLSHFYSGNDNWDVRLSDDLRYVFVGCQGSGLYTSTPLGDCTDDDGVPNVPPGNEKQGIVTVDIADPRNPVALCWSPTQSNHNVFTATLDDGTTVVVNDQTEIFVLQEDGCLQKVASVPGRHDAHIAKHPLTGDWILYTGTDGLTLHRINDPANPEHLGRLDTAGVQGATGWHEQSPAPVLYGDRHITMGGGERFSGTPGPVTAIDTTDPENPVALGAWRLPLSPPLGLGVLVGQQSYIFSEHNVAMNQWGQVCIGHYHAGVWIIDVSTPERQAAPVTLAFYQPHELSPMAVSTGHPAGGKMTESPYVWGCAWTEDGRHVIVADMHSGLYVLEGEWFEPL